MKRIFIVLFIFSILFFGFVSAQLGNIESQIEDVAGNLENNITKIKEFTEGSKWDFIGAQWKEYLLKNKAIAGVDAFFTKINPIFLFLFARDWSISLGMLFVFMLWLFTLLSAYWFASAYALKMWQSWLISLGGAIFLAHLRIFNLLASISEKIILYKVGYWWRLSIFVLIVFLIHVYLFVSKFLSKQIKLSRQKEKQENLEGEVNKGKVFRESLQTASNEI